MQARSKNARESLKDKDLDALIATNPTNIYYLTGFRGVSPLEREALVVLTPKKSTLITARLYQSEAFKIQTTLQGVPLEVQITDERDQIHQLIIKALKGSTKVGFEQYDLKFSEFLEFKKLLKGKKFIPTKHLVEDLRIVKTSDEIKKIEKAQIISQRAFEQVVKTIKAGQTEAQIGETLEKIIKSLGGQGLAFDPIIASGPNSAKPHHVTSNRRLTRNDILLLDFGAKFGSYCADLTRTIFLGKAGDEARNIYNYVSLAQQKTIAKIKKGVKGSRAHKQASDHFKKHKLDTYFIHSLGHGIGLEVHEKPSLSYKSKDVLHEGMVFSIEPGLYFPVWGGVRIEDLVTIRGGNAQILGKQSRLLEITP